jgi:hypothetical protein
LKILVHSIVDLITNSSTEIFSWPRETAVKAAKSMLEEIMHALGVTGSVDDYFDISLETRPGWEDRVRQALAGEVSEAVIDRIVESRGFDREAVDMAFSEGGPPPGTLLVVTTKCGLPIDLENSMLQIFDIDECEEI